MPLNQNSNEQLQANPQLPGSAEVVGNEYVIDIPGPVNDFQYQLQDASKQGHPYMIPMYYNDQSIAMTGEYSIERNMNQSSSNYRSMKIKIPLTKTGGTFSYMANGKQQTVHLKESTNKQSAKTEKTKKPNDLQLNGSNNYTYKTTDTNFTYRLPNGNPTTYDFRKPSSNAISSSYNIPGIGVVEYNYQRQEYSFNVPEEMYDINAHNGFQLKKPEGWRLLMTKNNLSPKNRLQIMSNMAKKAEEALKPVLQLISPDNKELINATQQQQKERKATKQRTTAALQHQFNDVQQLGIMQ